jgi:hypothetical protein
MQCVDPPLRPIFRLLQSSVPAAGARTETSGPVPSKYAPCQEKPYCKKPFQRQPSSRLAISGVMLLSRTFPEEQGDFNSLVSMPEVPVSVRRYRRFRYCKICQPPPSADAARVAGRGSLPRPCSAGYSFVCHHSRHIGPGIPERIRTAFSEQRLVGRREIGGRKLSDFVKLHPTHARFKRSRSVLKTKQQSFC